MTHHEAGERIVIWWCMDISPRFIAFWLTMLYAPLTVRQVLVVVRRYCDESSENKRPVAGEVTWHKETK